MYMKNLLYLFFLCESFLGVASCRPEEDETHHYKIHVENDWSKGVFIDYSCSKYDTIYTTNGSFDPEECLLPDKTTHLSIGSRTTWENFFSRPDNDTLHMYLLDAESVFTRLDKSLLVRYDLSLQDLRCLDWQITFPPTEEMKDIHMWPSYDAVVQKYQD